MSPRALSISAATAVMSVAPGSLLITCATESSGTTWISRQARQVSGDPISPGIRGKLVSSWKRLTTGISRHPRGPCRTLSGSQVASSGQMTRITTISTISPTMGIAVLAM